MRRHSPPRSMRQRSPQRKRGRVRSLSPLSRNQPAPPGEEHGRKTSQWEAQNTRNKRLRSRSREWLDRPREDFGRDLAFTHIDSDRPRGREPFHDKISRDREFEKSRERNREERNRERDRPLHTLSRGTELKDSKSKIHRRHSPDRIQNRPDEFEESYLDRQAGHYGNSGGVHRNHEELILEQPETSFDVFQPDLRFELNSQDKNRDMQRNAHQLPRDVHHPSDRGNLGSSNLSNREIILHEKEESATERINRLEKLVERLVEKNVSPEKSKDFGYPLVKGPIPELIPSNTKFTTSMWLNSIHEECLNRNYDERSVIRFVKDQMSGIMKAWFKSVANYDFTWPELKLLITKTFPDNVEFAQTLRMLVARDKTSDETITQYYFSKVYLCEACKITGENAVSCLIDGLSNPFMKQDLKSYNFLTPEALYSEYLSKFPENEVPIRMDRRDLREVVPEYSHDDFISLELSNRQQDEVGVVLSYQQDRYEDKEKHDKKKCFTCKKYGHSTLDCRHAPICYKCKKKGHIAAKCHYSKINFISSILTTVVPKIGCSINGKQYYGIIDTGSAVVCLQQQVAWDLGLKTQPTADVLKGYGGFEIIPLGETEILLKVNSTERLVKSIIVEDQVQDVPVIIGQAFLNQDGVGFFQKNGEVNIFDSKINLFLE